MAEGQASAPARPVQSEERRSVAGAVGAGGGTPDRDHEATGPSAFHQGAENANGITRFLGGRNMAHAVNAGLTGPRREAEALRLSAYEINSQGRRGCVVRTGGTQRGLILP